MRTHSTHTQVEQAADKPAHINAIHFVGVERTKRSFLESAIQRALQARTLGDVVTETHNAVADLMGLDIFEAAEIHFDRAKGPGSLGDGLHGGMDAIVSLRERKRWWARTGTEVGNGEGSLSGSIAVRNALGNAERLSADVAFGTRTSSAFLLAFSKPLGASPNRWLDLQAHQALRNNSLYSSHDERVRGLLARYRFLSPLVGKQEIWWEGAWRNVHRVTDQASLSVREDAGHSVKSAIGHSWTLDTRDDPFMPTSGASLRLLTELAGANGVLGGDVDFLKNELEAQASYSPRKGWILTSTLRAGHLLSSPLARLSSSSFSSSGPCRTRINDRFFLGGPMTLRGFAVNGVGPQDGKDAIGGDIYAAAGLSLFTPLPRVETEAFKGHLFANAGSLRSISPQDQVKSLIATPSSAVGLGLVYRHSVARIEMNFCLPITATSTDRIKSGVQFGLGISFL
ncbi:MAG: surface antigen-domain-containing protein [Piptocephalis tieghemiana]|nr:MAG: surface antigen-domain-containing protein [Piptocephalis tieghemiana]